MAPKRLGGLDAAFIAAESPANHMHMMAIMVLDPSTVPGGYTFEKLRDFIVSRLPGVAPLRRRLVEVPFGIARPIWIEEDEIDIDLHVRRMAVPKPGSPREVAAIAAEMNERKLDRSRPLWEMAIVEGLENGSIALLAKVHHALMDGMAGVRLMATLVSAEPDATSPPVSKKPEPERVPGDLEMLLRAVPKVAERPLRIAKLGGSSLLAQIEDWIRKGRDDDTLPEPNPVVRTTFNRRISPRRSAAYTALPLADVKAVASAFDVTLNDVVLALVGGAIRAHLIANGQPLDEPVVAGVPVSTHDPDGDDLTNSYSVMFSSLASNIADPVERLAAVHRSCEIEKRRKVPFWGEALAELTEIPSPLLLGIIARAYTSLGLSDQLKPFCNLVVSNVPGPPVMMYFGGARIQDIYPLGPIFDGVGLNITVMSVEKKLDVGISTCREILRDPWGIATSLSAALAELLERIPGEECLPDAEAHLHTASD